MAYNQSFTDLEQLDSTDTEWEACTFINCTLKTLSQQVFIDCVFDQCNLSNAHVSNTAFRNCTFKDCELMGVNFSSSREFGFEIHVTNCNLDYTAFDRKKVYQSKCINNTFKGANFTEADISKSIFENCDFAEAVFMNTNMSGVNFTTNYHFHIDPTLNNMTKARFSRFALSGLLYNTGIEIE
jgi:fluoroquinolone resistance protein